MENLELQDRLDRYVRNEMTDAERSEFEKEMGNNPSLAEEVSLDLSIKQQINSLASMREKMAEMKGEMDKRDRVIKHRNIALKTVLSIAACILLAFVIVPTIPGGSDVDTSPSEPTFRGDMASDTIEQLLNNNQYQEALDQVLLALNDTCIDTSLSKEEQEYQRMVLNDQVYELKWLQIKALIGLGNIKEAKSLLQDYALQEGPHATEADSLYKEIGE